jgi:flagellar protein FlgJ
MSNINFAPGATTRKNDAGPIGSSNAKKSAEPDDSRRQIKEACTEFEALFINMMLKELRATVNKSGFMDGGKAEELYTGLMDTQISRDLASQGGIGLAAMLYRQMAAEIDARPAAADPNPPAGHSKKGPVHADEK